MTLALRLHTLSDTQLLTDLERLCEQEASVGAAIVAHLCEVERRRLHLDLGYSSLYTYCVERLGLSDSVAYKRMRVARLASEFPEVLDHLAARRLTLASAVVLASHVKSEGDRELIDRAVGKSSRQVEALVAERTPDAEWPRGQFRVRAVGKDLYKVEVTVDAETLDKLEAARDLDRHIDAEADVGELLSRALDAYLAARRKARFAATDRPRAANEETDAIPAAVKRTVWERDGGQCAWVGTDGHRCTCLLYTSPSPRDLN